MTTKPPGLINRPVALPRDPEPATIPAPPLPEPPRRGGFGWIFFLLLALAAGLGIYWGIHSRIGSESKLVTATDASAVPFVKVIHPKAGSSSGEISLPGSTQAFIDTPLYARTSGYLKNWYFDIGAKVKKGDLLAEIESPEIDQQLQQAQADLKNAQANLQISQTTAGRYQSLLQSHSVSTEETDQATANLRSKQALVDSGQANVRRLQQMQGFEKIYAPFDGVITARNTDIGALIQSGDNTLPKELFHLAAIGRLRIYVSVPEVYSSAVVTGENVNLTVDSLPGTIFIGTVVRNSDAIDQVTRTLNVEVDVNNSEGKLLPGAYAFVHFKIPATSGSVTISSDTLLFRAEGLRVGVVRNGHAHLIPITIGHDYGSSVEVTSGLTPDDAVISNPSDSLTEGEAVRIDAPSQKAAAP